MTRPTKQQVDDSLEDVADRVRMLDGEVGGALSLPEKTLAAEVMALREELAAFQERPVYARLIKANAMIHAELAAYEIATQAIYNANLVQANKPRYSTEAVDALLSAIEDRPIETPMYTLRAIAAGVRASREPRS